MTIQQLLVNSHGDYATWNPSDKGSGVTLSGGDLTASITTTGGANGLVRATIGKASGKYYWEITLDSTNTSFVDVSIGVANTSASIALFLGKDANGWAWYQGTGTITNNTHPDPNYDTTLFAVNEVIGVALDMDSGTLVFYRDGVSKGTAFSSLTGTLYPAISNGDSISSVTSGITANFGASSFAYPPPAGYGPL